MYNIGTTKSIVCNQQIKIILVATMPEREKTMDKIIKRTAQCASLGGMIGTAIGAIVVSTAAVVAAPITLPTALAFAATSAVAGGASAGAIGTLIGGGFGAATGTVETVYDHKRQSAKEVRK